MEEIVIRKSIVKWKKKTTKDNTFNLYFIKQKKRIIFAIGKKSKHIRIHMITYMSKLA